MQEINFCFSIPIGRAIFLKWQMVIVDASSQLECISVFVFTPVGVIVMCFSCVCLAGQA